jgi:hypothetical protein
MKRNLIRVCRAAQSDRRAATRRRHWPRLEALELRLAPANVDVLSFHNDPSLDGQNLQEETLTLSNVSATNFGRLVSQPVDGPLYAQPLYKANLMIGANPHNVAFVATEHDSVYAFDFIESPTAGLTVNQLWKTSFIDPANGITPIPASELGNPDIVPEIGITGTPVIDGTTNTLYALARTKEVRSGVPHYVEKLHALDITTGAEKFGGPYTVGDTTSGGSDGGWTNTTSIVVPGQGDGAGPEGMVRFNAGREMQRPALQLTNGVVYVAWASQSDFRPYHGWVVGFNATTLQPVRWFNTTPNAGGAGIWESGGGLSVDPQGNIFFAEGNGFNGPFLAFDPAHNNYSESVLKLTPSGSQLNVNDYFTPYDWQALDQQDADLGSGGAMLLPDYVGSAAHPHLMVELGKSGKLYLIDRDNMGKINNPPNGPDLVVQTVTAGQKGVWGNASFFKVNATTGIIYYHGTDDVLKGYTISNGHIDDINILKSNFNSQFPGTQPVVSANGIANPISPTNGITWELQVDAHGLGQQPNTPAVLRAFPSTNLPTELYDSSQTGLRDQPDPGNKFTSLAVSNGRVLIGTFGYFSVYGLFPAATAVPAPRTNLAGTLGSGPQGPQIQLTWTNPPPDVGTAPTGIKVLRSIDGTNFTLYTTVPRDATAFTDTGPFVIGLHYYYQVVATNQKGDSSPSNTVNVLVPIASSVLTLTGTGASSIGLSWIPVANDHYDVERSSNGGAFTKIATVPAFQTSYGDTGLAPGIYAYRVHAYNVNPTADSLSNVVGASIGATIDHSTGFANTADLTPNGSTQFAETTVRLTNGPKQTGSSFSNTRITTAKFTTTFQLRLHEGTQPNYADGVTFVIQANAPTALGQGLGGLGYQGIGHSVAVKFSTFQHTGDPSSSSTGFVVNGANPAGGIDTTPSGVLLNSQDQKDVTLTYDGSTLSETITDVPKNLTFTTSFTNVNIPALIGSDTAFIGFTGATGSGNVEGGYWQIQDIVNWKFTSQAPLPGAPSNLRVASATSSQIDLAWNANSYNETGFQIERSTDGTTWNQVGTSTTPGFSDLGLAGGTYYYRVRAVNAAGNSAYSNVLKTGVAGPILTQDQDVGTPGDPPVLGSASFAGGGVYTNSGAGSDIWNQADGFHFVYRPLLGDGTIQARVLSMSSIQDTTYWAKAGVMIRETLAANSRDAYVTMTPQGHNQVQFLDRVDTGANANDIGDAFNIPFPIWVRVVRQGNTLSGFYSTNGTSWIQLGGTVTIPMAPTVYVGLVASAANNNGGNPNNLSTSMFDNVSVVPAVLQTSHLDVTAASAVITPGAPLNVSVRALDLYNNPVPGYLGTVHFTSSDTMAGLPADYTFTAADNGVHVFSVTFKTLGRQTVTVTDTKTPAITGATAVTVANQVLGSLVVAGFPSPATVGVAGSFTVTARDTNGFTFTAYLGTVHFSSSDSKAVLPPDYTFTAADNGVHTFQATLNTLGSQTITATDLDAHVSGSQTVVVNPPTIFTVDHSAGFATTGDLQANGVARFVPTTSAVGAFPGHQDIGNVGLHGDASFANGVYTVKGSGADIWDTADAFQFVYQPLIGDGQITARVTSTQATDFYSKAGVMIRETLDANSPQATTYLFPPGHDAVEFERRISRGSASSADTANVNNLVRPQWVRLVRSGNNFTSFRSDNGTTWIQIGGTVTIPMATTVYVGLDVTAHNNNALNTVTFDNVTITGTTGPLTTPVARLADGDHNEAGSIFTKQVVPFTNFSTTFTFQDIKGLGTGDGFTFMIQGNGPSALGGNGGGMGSIGIAKSVAVKFDFWSHGSLHSTTGLYLDGQDPSDPNNIGKDMTPAGIDLSSNHLFSVTLGYDGITLSEVITDTVTKASFGTAYNVDIGANIGANGGYVGFTGGTGGDTADYDIHTWIGQFSSISPTGSFVVSGFPSPTGAGAAGTFTVTAKDANGNTNPNYVGTVHFSSSDNLAVLPPDYTFTAADHGVHAFSATLNTPGTQSLGATDFTNRVTGSQYGIVVNPGPAITSISRSAAVISEGGTLTVNATFTDPQPGRTHVATVVWGDGTANTTLNLAVGVTIFGASHAYQEEGTFEIHVTVQAPDNSSDTVILSASAAAVPPPSGLVSWWTGDGNSATTAPDIAGTNPGTLINGATYAPGKVGNAFSFNGNGQYVNLPTGTNIPIGNGTYTLMAWINPKVAGDEGIIGYGNYGNGNQVNAFRLLNDGTGHLNFRHYWWANDLDAFTTIAANSGAWHLVVAEFDGTTRSIVLDGQVIASDHPTGHNVPSAGNFRIGSTNNGEFFNGLIDELQVYNRALTLAEIQALYNAGSAGQVKGVRGNDVPVAAKGGFTVTAVAGDPSGVQTVATFTDPGGAEPLADYSAMINWGDNGTSPGTIVGPSTDGVFTIQASHTYIQPGSYPITVTVHHDSATEVQATSAAQVDPRILHLVVGGFPSPVTAGSLGTFTVTVKDQLGFTVTDYHGTVHFTSSDQQAILPADYTFTTGDQGSHVFAAELRTSGTQSLTATDTVTSTITGTQAGIVVNPAATSVLVVNGFPSPASAGKPGNFTVTAQDAYGNVTPAYSGAVHFTSSDPLAQLPADSTLTNGTGTFTATLKTVGTQSITATDIVNSSITGTQAGIIVNPAAFVVQGFPSPIAAGTAGSFTVSAVDANGDLTPTYVGTVHFTSSDPKAQLPADYTFTAGDNGSHTFSATLFTAGTQSLTATDAVAGIAGTQAGIIVTAAGVSELVVTGFASPTTAGEAHNFSVTALDAYGNTVTDYSGTVHFSSSDPKAQLPDDFTFAPVNHGTNFFTAVLYTAGTQSLTATDTSNGIAGTQDGIIVNPASAVTLQVAGFPSPITAGTPGTFTVTAQDFFGNTATGYTGTVHFSSSDPKAQLPDDYTFTAGDNGTHTFSATLFTVGIQSITAKDTVGSFSGTQSGIEVTPAATSAFVVSGYPSPTKVGEFHDFTVTAVDAYGNVTPGYTGTVTFSSDDGLANLPAEYNFSAGDMGMHVFSAAFNQVGTFFLKAIDMADPGITGSQNGIEVIAG